MDFNAQLKRQYLFLTISVNSYDSGYREEAIRIVEAIQFFKT